MDAGKFAVLAASPVAQVRACGQQPAGEITKDELPRLVGDRKVHADAAGRGAIHFGHGHLEHDLLFARDAQQVDDVASALQNEAVDAPRAPGASTPN